MLFDVDSISDETLLEAIAGSVHSVACSPDGQILATGSGGVRLWDLATRIRWRLLRPLDGPKERIQSIAFSNDGRILAVACRTRVKLWDIVPTRGGGEK